MFLYTFYKCSEQFYGFLWFLRQIFRTWRVAFTGIGQRSGQLCRRAHVVSTFPAQGGPLGRRDTPTTYFGLLKTRSRRTVVYQFLMTQYSNLHR